MSVINMGDFLADETVYIPFNTYDADGASVTVTNLVAGDVHIHKDGGTTQRSSSAGITVSIDFDTITGNHLVSIDLSDNTDAGFYAVGSDYTVRLEGITVATKTINAWIGAFSIENRWNEVDVTKWNGTAVATPDTAGYPKITIKDGTGAGEIALTSGAIDTVTTLTGHTAQTGDNYARLGAPAGASIAADIVAVNAKTTNLPADPASETNVDANETKIDTLTTRVGTPGNLGSGASLGANLADMAGATFSSATDSQEAIRNRGDAEWITAVGAGLASIATGTAQAGAAGTITLAAGASAVANFYKGARIVTTGGTGAGQSRMITAYDESTKIATIAPNWATNPGADTTYEIQAADSHVGLIEAADPTDTIRDSVLSDATRIAGVDVNAITSGGVKLNAQGKLDVNAEVDTALNTAIPGAPTADSINERLAAIDDKLPTGTISDFDESSNQVIVTTNNDKTGYSISGTKQTLDALTDISAAQVNAEVLDVMNTDTIPELSQGIPPVNPTAFQALMMNWMLIRNKATTTATELGVYNDAGTKISKAAISDDSTTYEKAEMVSGA